MFQIPEQHRVQDLRLPFHQDAESCPDFGAFLLPPKIGNRQVFVIASSGVESGWEHVSVSVRQGGKPLLPTWPEMAYVKALFWSEEDTVIEYHPRRSEYVNMVSCVLHLWRPVGIEIPLPPSIFVGLKDNPDEWSKQLIEGLEALCG